MASEISLEKAEHLLATSPDKAIKMLEMIGMAENFQKNTFMVLYHNLLLFECQNYWHTSTDGLSQNPKLLRLVQSELRTDRGETSLE